MDPRFIVQRYCQLQHVPMQESFNNDTRMFTITLGDTTVSVRTDSTKQAAKTAACEKMLEVIPAIRKIGLSPRTSTPGIDYVAYSRDTILRGARMHLNDLSFFDMDHKVVSFDSEGRPLRLAQFCCNKTDVYLFDLPQYYDDVIRVLTNPNIKRLYATFVLKNFLSGYLLLILQISKLDPNARA